MQTETVKNGLFFLLCLFVIGSAVKQHYDNAQAERVWGDRIDKVLQKAEKRGERIDAFLEDWESRKADVEF